MRCTFSIDEKILESWDCFLNNSRFESRSELIRTGVNLLMEYENGNSHIDRSLSPIRNQISSLYDLVNDSTQTLEFVRMKISDDGKPNDEVVRVGREIIWCFLENYTGSSLCELASKTRCDNKTVVKAINLLEELGVIGNKYPKMKENQEDNKNDEKDK